MTDDARDAIMLATYEALRAEGYSELTAQSIADRTDKSKAALFYHYESKDELIGAFIDYLVEGFEARIERTSDQRPVDRLAAFVEWWCGPAAAEETGYLSAMLELRAQAPYNETYREKLRASDDQLRSALVEILEDGMDSGEFRPHDAEVVADLLLAAADGARIRQLTIGRDSYSETVRDGLVAHLLADLLEPETAYPADPSISIPPDERLDGVETSDEAEGSVRTDGEETE
ncbi:TetR/AcrR family transcriptional regulator [Halovivax gelatinilyticus]|uniref:TetR/AcrR family transcriptional regulator n=1 Tax=Halovivax gelatinilyticus TaxID=2961597 RepID=UPI0020CA81B7|nr:TetR/AcrR family transcriptional regulator [Halovivax gelatinilyticus]